MDVKYGETYVDRIAAALKQADPTDAAGFDSRAAAYKTSLEALDASIRTRIATIPEANRKLVTFHDAFPYFARGVRHHDRRRRGRGAGQDPSAAYTAQLIDAIKASGSRRSSARASSRPSSSTSSPAETGTKVVADLYDDSVGDPPVDSYEAVINWDVDQLVTALR